MHKQYQKKKGQSKTMILGKIRPTLNICPVKTFKVGLKQWY